MNKLNFLPLKQQQSVWASGDYGKIGITLQITGEQLCEYMSIRSGQKVLDVAAGNGNATLAAARRFCDVTSTDCVPHLLKQGQQRCEANGLAVNFQVADAENLPFSDGQFDALVSTFGVMFTPNQAQSTKELLRVCRKGGKIGLASWTPTGFIGQLFKIVSGFVVPPRGIASPANWGTEGFVHSHFAASANNIELRKQNFNFRYQSAGHCLDLFQDYFGPIHNAFNTLSETQAAELKSEIFCLIQQFNIADDSTILVPSEYLEVVITL